MEPQNSKSDSPLKITLTRLFNAPRALVFDAWTKTEHLAQWSAPRGFTIPESRGDLRVGGTWWCCMVGANGLRLPLGGVYREIVPNERLVFTHCWEDDQGKIEHETVVTVTFAEESGKTRVTLEQSIFKSVESRDGHFGGWSECFELLEEHLACLTEKAAPLVVERVFNAPVEVVWKALTDVEQMRVWYFELSDFKPEVGFEFSFVVEHHGMTYDHRCKVTEVIPLKRLAYTWRYAGHPGESLVAFDFFADGSKTRLRVTHTGLETFPMTGAFPRTNFEKGWNALLGKWLLEFLENTVSPIPEFEISRVFDAPRAVVWKAWTEKEQLKQWFGPKGSTLLVSKGEFIQGGIFHYCMQTAEGQTMWGRFKYREIVEPERLVWINSFSDEAGGITRPPFSESWPLEMRTTVTFEEKGSQTQITVKWMPIHAREEEFKTFDQARAGMNQGWTGTFEQFTEYLKKKNL